MKMFGSIFRHGFVIVLVLGISIAYVYRQQLFPAFFKSEKSAGMTPDPVVQIDTSESEHTLSVESAQTGEKEERLTVNDDSTQTDRAKEGGSGAHHEVPDKDSKTESVKKEQPNEGSGSVTERALPKTGISRSPAINKPAAQSGVLEAPLAPENIPGQGMDRSDEVDAAQHSGMVAVIDSKNSQEQQYFSIINNARHAFWQGNYKESVTLYEQAILHLPARVDAYGELGNVYYAMGEWDRSGENLYLAALRLIESGEIEAARYLSSVIKGLKPERAKELDKKLLSE